MTKLAKVPKHLKFCEDTIKWKNTLEIGFLDIGKRLRMIRDDKMWEGRWEDFDHFCREDMKLTQQSAYKLIGIYEKFVLEYKFAPARIAAAGGWGVVAEILPLAIDADAAEAWVSIAEKSQSRRDLRQLIREGKTGVDPMKCKHKDAKEIVMMMCSECGERWRKYPDGK